MNKEPAVTESPVASTQSLPTYAALMLDASHCIRACGNAAATLFGHPIQAMIGQPVSNLLPDFAALTGMQGRSIMVQLNKVRLDAMRADGTTLRVVVSLLNDLDSGSGQHLLCIRALSSPARQEERLRSAKSSTPARPSTV